MQVIHEVDKVQTEADGTPTEAKLTQGLTHPSVVGMHAYKLVEGVRRQSLEGQFKHAASLKNDELWLILEFCDSGSVQVCWQSMDCQAGHRMWIWHCFCYPSGTAA